MLPRILLSLAFIAVAVYLGLALLLYLGQSRLVYLPTRSVEATPADAGLPWEEVTLRTGDGVRVVAWWVPPPPGGRGAVLFLHGNAGNLSHRIGTLRTMHELGVGTLLLSYRGYGPSEGRPTERGTYLDALAAWEHLVSRPGVDPTRVVVHGRSLGAAVGAWLAVRHPPAGLVVEGAFTSVPELAADIYPWLPVRLLARIRYDTRARLAEAEVPLLVIHARHDEIVPLAHGQALAAAAAGPARLVELDGGHNDAHLRSPERYRAELGAFLEEVGLGHPPP